jgi:hypothetical protein
MRICSALIALLLSTAAHASSDRVLRPTSHQMDITIAPKRQSMSVRDLITVPPEDTEAGSVTFELANFIAQPHFQVFKGATGLSITKHPGDFGRLWTLAAQGYSGGPLSIKVTYSIERPRSAQLAIRQEGSFAGSSGDSWYPQLDYSVSESGRLIFHVPTGETVIATGKRMSTPADEKRGLFKYDVAQPLKFAFAAAHYHRYASSGSRFSLYALRERPELNKLSHQLGPSLAVLEQMYGPFPYGPPALVEVNFPTIVLGASETGFILADDSEIGLQSELYWVHEFAHQWWGNVVRPQPKSAASTLLTEGLAEFSALEVIEKLKGTDVLRKLRAGQLASEGESPILQYDRLASSNQDRSLRDWTAANGDEALLMHRLATSKGAQVLSMLSHQIGDQRVIAALRELIDRNRGGRISWPDVEKSFSRAAGRDLSGEFGTWLGRAGIANLQTAWSQAAGGGEVTGIVNQIGLVYDIPLEVELRGSAPDGRVLRRTLQLNGRETAFRFAPGFQVREVRLDPDYRIFRRPLPSDLH